MTHRALALSLTLAWTLGPVAASADPPTVEPADPALSAPLSVAGGDFKTEAPEKPPAGEGHQRASGGLSTSVPKHPSLTLPPEPPPKRGRQAALEAAMDNYLSFGAAPVVWRPGGVVFPFGEAQPIVTCTTLRVCDIELEEGEVIRDVALGDTERWVAQPLSSGEVDRTRPHVLVKPKEFGVATNLVIGTTRRTYHLALVSPAESEVRGQVGHDHYISFYYPDDMVESWATEDELRQSALKRPKPTTVDLENPASFSVGDLHFAYTVEPDRRVTWAPQTVFDDGEHVYIKLPESVRSGDLPALLVRTEGGELALHNYRVDGLWYIVDGLFEKAELVQGVGKGRRKVSINRRSGA